MILFVYQDSFLASVRWCSLEAGTSSVYMLLTYGIAVQHAAAGWFIGPGFREGARKLGKLQWLTRFVPLQLTPPCFFGWSSGGRQLREVTSMRRHGSVEAFFACSGVWFGLVRFGSVWFGLAQFARLASRSVRSRRS